MDFIFVLAIVYP